MSFQQQSRANIAATEAEEERRRFNKDAAKLYLREPHPDALSRPRVTLASRVGAWFRRMGGR